MNPSNNFLIIKSFDNIVQLNLQNHYVLKNVAPGSEDYKVEQVHFHWGHSGDNIHGSEHLHEGNSYPLEVSTENTSLVLD